MAAAPCALEDAASLRGTHWPPGLSLQPGTKAERMWLEAPGGWRAPSWRGAEVTVSPRPAQDFLAAV